MTTHSGMVLTGDIQSHGDDIQWHGGGILRHGNDTVAWG